MAGLVPAIHVVVAQKKSKTWMPGTRPGMTRVWFEQATSLNSSYAWGAQCRCSRCGANMPSAVNAIPASVSRPEIQESAIMPVMMVAEASTIPI
jgi:hypothetical protein